MEFKDAPCRAFYQEKGIIHQTSCTYRPQQNGRAERRHRNLLEMGRALRFQSGLPLMYWGDCILTAAYIINRVPTRILGNKSPYEVLHQKGPDYTEMKSFGCLVFAYNSSPSKDKFKARGMPGMFLGYPGSQKGYKVLNLLTNQVIVSRDVKFFETVFPYRLNPEEFRKLIPKHSVQTTPPEPTVGDFSWIEMENDDSTDEGKEKDTPEDEAFQEDEQIAVVEQTRTEETHSHDPENTQPLEGVRRSERSHKPPSWMGDYDTGKKRNQKEVEKVANVTPLEIGQAFNCFMNKIQEEKDPIFFKDAIKKQHWIQAMNDELKALEDNHTWDIVDLPQGKKAIGCKWLYKTKYNSKGEVERYKSRLVVLGNNQTYGIDYDQTFAPVEKLTIVRSVLAVASIEGWTVEQMDVKNAFLHGELNEEVYMKLPTGYAGPGKKIHAIQGEKSEFSNNNPNKESTFVCILVYVDDLIIAGNDREEIEKIKQFLSNTFHMKELGELKYFLGIEVHRSNKGIFLSQKKYLRDIIEEFGESNKRPLKLPMDSHIKLIEKKGDPLPDPTIYQRLIGKLIYLTLTRPDITYTVHVLSRFTQEPTTVHLQAARRVLRYLTNCPGQGVLLANNSAAKLSAYCDSDWAGCPNTRRSTTGFCIMLGNSSVSWKSKR